MKIAVYNRYWSTAGGGERFAGGIAHALASDHEVHLLTPEEVDWRALEERLGLDLSRARPRFVEDAGFGSLEEATRSYDLLVNCSYMSSGASGATRGLYVVHFPGGYDELPAAKQLVARLLRPVGQSSRYRVEWGRGFHLPEAAKVGTYRWTSGRSQLLVWGPEGERIAVRLTLAGRAPGLPPADVSVEYERRVVAALAVESGRRAVPVAFEVVGSGPSQPTRVDIRSTTFVPHDGGASDVRELGVRLRSVRVGSSLGSVVRERFPGLTAPPPSLDFLQSYGQIVSNSEYTREWVRRLWHRESDVLYPPVDAIAPLPKESLILAVGRFFGKAAGHSKKQLELVRAFRRLVRGGAAGWELHLVGGCAPEHVDYLDQVRREARGLPVTFHVDASGAELRDLYGRASLFWHATGLGEDRERQPHRLEHFGISTVEAMSAGAVPVVFGAGGQPEIVEDSVSGMFFETLDGLVEASRRLIGHEAERERLSLGAIERARAFAPDRFAERLQKLVASGSA
jgi:glycosyltransferase involved in cell wall biosynthesis